MDLAGQTHRDAHNILLIDDSATARKTVHQLLSRMGYKTSVSR